tara:strand:+ start:1029 stop:1145 length:117 start_codon:yes stop_codon:yes gene_type:complete
MKLEVSELIELLVGLLALFGGFCVGYIGGGCKSWGRKI